MNDNILVILVNNYQADKLSMWSEAFLHGDLDLELEREVSELRL